MLLDNGALKSNPGTLQREHLESLAELVTGDGYMLIRFSSANASGSISQKYQLYESRYARLYDYKPWKPWYVGS